MLFRKAVLIIHGYAGGTYDEEELANYLELDYRLDVYRFTLPGHEKNLSKVKYTEWVDKSEEYLNRLINNGYHTIYLIGHSMGGVIATYLASKYKIVKKLVLAAPAFQFLSVENNELHLKDSIKDAASLVKTYGGDEIVGRFLKLDVSTIKEFTKLVEKYHDCPKEIKCPVLLIHGTSDRLIPNKSSKYVYENVQSKRKTFYLVNDMTHDVFRSKNDEVIFYIVKEFLRFRLKNGEYKL